MIVTMPPKKFQKRQPKPRTARALTLTAATYQSATSVRLTFDRPVTFAEVDVTAVTVDDGVTTGTLFRGTGVATLIAPDTVEIALVGVGMATMTGVYLSVTDGTQIVAVNDGGQWAGVPELLLPFP